MLKLCHLFSPPTRPQTGHHIHSLPVCSEAGLCRTFTHSFSTLPYHRLLDGAVMPAQGFAFLSLSLPVLLGLSHSRSEEGDHRLRPFVVSGWMDLGASWWCLPAHQPFPSISMYTQRSSIWTGLSHFRIRPLPRMQPLPAGEPGKGWVILLVSLVCVVSGGCQRRGSATASCPGSSPAPTPPPLMDRSSAGDCIKLGMPERHI